MNLTDPIFTDKDAAREYLEGSRWADGVCCPHCNGRERIRCTPCGWKPYALRAW